MTEQQNYLLRMCIVIPMLPVLILQGKYVRWNIPSLPEAIEPTGAVIRDSEKVIRVIGRENALILRDLARLGGNFPHFAPNRRLPRKSRYCG